MGAAGHVVSMTLIALVGGDRASDIAAIREFNRRACQRGGTVVAGLETRCESPTQVADVVRQTPAGVTIAIEVPLSGDLEDLVIAAALPRQVRRRRSEPEALRRTRSPRPTSLVPFMRACLDAGVPFKATAGLHHPICVADVG